MSTPEIDFLRPYPDTAIPAAMERVLRAPAFELVRQGYFPGASARDLQGAGSQVRGWSDFQRLFIKPAIDRLLATSSDGFSISGFERLERSRRYVFVANHRDIVGDPALFTYGMHCNGWESPFICLGDNLLVNEWITDLVKMNRGVTVKRGLPPRELMHWSRALSQLINQAVRGGEASVWIAQREGRAKDGVDETHPGVLKMLTLGSERPVLDALADLHLVPVAISYEYDPCDALKARELQILEERGAYAKAPGEDVRSMALGLRGAKGRIHIEIGSEFSDEASGVIGRARRAASRNEQLQAVASGIDEQVRALYRSWPTAYVAREWLRQGHPPSSAGHGFTSGEAARFVGWTSTQLAALPSDGQASADGILRKLLQMYAHGAGGAAPANG